MTLLLVLSALATAFVLVTAGVEWVDRRLRQEPPGYVDTSRGDAPRPRG